MSRLACSVTVVGLAFGVGCSTTNKPTHQFTAVPAAQVGAQDLEPVTTRSVTELLKAADEAFRNANEAQEAGDQKAALRHYNTMLQLLIQADLDPSVFYSLRNEFERILDSSTETADLFERSGIGQYNSDALSAASEGAQLFSKGFINERVIAEIEEIQNLYARNFQAGLDRSYKYRPYIEQQLAKAGLPKDLVWLAMVESQFHPNVKSPAGAVGMWQFMRATGSRYGLDIDSYVDERRDWQEATDAAIAYLKDLNTMFEGDWPLTVASYNMGEGGVSRAIAMNGGERDLWRLIETPPASSHIKNETKKFYPKLLASILVGKSPERYGFQRRPQAPEQTVRIPVKGSYSLSMLDKESGLPSGTLKQLNPDLIRGVTPPSRDHLLVVPAEANERFLATLDSIYKQPKGLVYAGGKGTHTVRRGETPSGIARKYGVGVKELMSVNGIRSASRLPVGKKLVIPGHEPDVIERVPIQVARATPRNESTGTATYRVKRGDTLYDISRAHGVSLDDMQAWNNLDRRAHIRIGETLYVSAPGGTSSTFPAAPTGERQVHKVRPGEFPAKIAHLYGVSLEDLLAWNNLSKKSIIRAGEELVLYLPGSDKSADRTQVATLSRPKSGAAQALREAESKSEPAPTPPANHTVRKGESASTIAAKYGVGLNDFLAWNGLTKKSVLHIGQECKVSDPSKDTGTTEPRVQMAKATHTVVSGESPWTIAAKYDMPLDDLLAMNGLSKKSVLHVGQELKVAGASGGKASAAIAEPKTHTVGPGESPWTIAQKYHISLDDLLAQNKLTRKSVLQVGQTLVVSGKGASDSGAASERKTVVHKTTAGQSPSTIARKYDVATSDLFEWNNWSRNHILKIGEEVTIYLP